MNKGRIAALVFIALLVALFFLLDLGRFLTLQSLKEHRALAQDFYRSHRLLTAGVFVVVYILQSALSLPGAAILSLAGGAVFGVLAGTVLVNIGATAGATLAFVMTRYLFHDLVARRFGRRLAAIDRELERSGLNYLLFLRLVPVFPFFLINLGAGLTKIPLRTFFFGTLIGIIPGSFVFCNAGASLATIETVRGILSLRVLGSFGLLGLFALLPVIYGKWKKSGERRGGGSSA